MAELHWHCEIVHDAEGVIARRLAVEDIGGITIHCIPSDTNVPATQEDIDMASAMYGQEADRRRPLFKNRVGVPEPSVDGYEETARQAVEGGGFVVRVTANYQAAIFYYLSTIRDALVT